MSRRAKEPIDNKEARAKLPPRGAPYYRGIASDAQLGFRKGQTKSKWVLRRRLEDGSYVVTKIGPADDDLADSLNFHQARDKALALVMGEAPPAKGASSRGKMRGMPFTVADALDAYFKKLDSEGKDTRKARSFAKSSILPALRHVRLRDLQNDREALNQWRANLVASPRKNCAGGLLPAPQTAEETRQRRASFNRIYATLRAALNMAVEDKHIASWKHIKPFENADAARVRWLSRDEIKRFLAACEEPFRSLALAGLFSGCRLGELRQLLVEDFDPRSETLCVRISKSGKSRHIILTKEAATFFARLCAGRAANEVLLKRADGKGWQDGEQQRYMRTACMRANIAPAGFHALRHTYASHAVQAGIPLLMVARSLGHADTKMCERHYAHLAPDHVRETIQTKMQPFGFDSDGSNIVTLRR